MFLLFLVRIRILFLISDLQFIRNKKHSIYVDENRFVVDSNVFDDHICKFLDEFQVHHKLVIKFGKSGLRLLSVY